MLFFITLRYLIIKILSIFLTDVAHFNRFLPQFFMRLYYTLWHFLKKLAVFRNHGSLTKKNQRNAMATNTLTVIYRKQKLITYYINAEFIKSDFLYSFVKTFAIAQKSARKMPTLPPLIFAPSQQNPFLSDNNQF